MNMYIEQPNTYMYDFLRTELDKKYGEGIGKELYIMSGNLTFYTDGDESYNTSKENLEKEYYKATTIQKQRKRMKQLDQSDLEYQINKDEKSYRSRSKIYRYVR